MVGKNGFGQYTKNHRLVHTQKKKNERMVARVASQAFQNRFHSRILGIDLRCKHRICCNNKQSDDENASNNYEQYNFPTSFRVLVVDFVSECMREIQSKKMDGK